MRIISGIHKGRRIQAPKKLPVRPTTDMAKEALFNILRNKTFVHGSTVLELFAGSGNMSYEFASRGASSITAVDEHTPCIKFIESTATKLEMPIDTIKADVFQFLSQHQGQYDLIFADPPYALDIDQFNNIPDLVFERNLLKEDGILIVEHSKHTDLQSHQYCTESRRYGGTVFSFFPNSSGEEE
ncbi:MAG: 16S rRNA (guanine(966)-N(2))-methyltransferase RsmD [Nonlabens sp.]